MRRFHTWCKESEQAGLTDILQRNEEAVDLKWKLTWGQGTDVLDMMGDVIGADERAAWDAVRERAWEEKEGRVETSRSVVHGDFWVGKYG